MGLPFVSQKIRISFLLFDGLEICWIRVVNSDEPLFLEKPHRSGEKQEIFYYRTGNESKDIVKMSDFYKVAKNRFNKILVWAG